MGKQDWRIDPVLLLLFTGMIFFTSVLIGVEHFFSSDGQLFQVISNIDAGFVGAFFMRVNPKTPAQMDAEHAAPPPPPPPPGPPVPPVPTGVK